MERVDLSVNFIDSRRVLCSSLADPNFAKVRGYEIL